MRYLSLIEVLELHEAVIASSGGAGGLRDIGALESAISQPRLTFDQADLYPDIVSKAAALCHSLVMNHPFVDGNKRVGHAAMEVFLILNGLQIDATVDEQDRSILDLASGRLPREELTAWVRDHVTDMNKE
jgi:death-on-curing protein